MSGVQPPKFYEWSIFLYQVDTGQAFAFIIDEGAWVIYDNLEELAIQADLVDVDQAMQIMISIYEKWREEKIDYSKARALLYSVPKGR